MSPPDVEVLPESPPGAVPAPLGPTNGEAGKPQDALRALTLRFPGWLLWYGTATGCWWALPPAHCRERVGLVEADTAAGLAVRIRWIEDCRTHLDPDRPDRPDWPDRPDRTDAPAVRQRPPYPMSTALGPGPAKPDGDASERSGEDGGTAVVHADRRVH